MAAKSKSIYRQTGCSVPEQGGETSRKHADNASPYWESTIYDLTQPIKTTVAQSQSTLDLGLEVERWIGR
jgi:hypothetical protein